MRYMGCLCLALIVAGCGPMDTARPVPVNSTSTVEPDRSPTKPDNTAVNQRDNNSNAKTPIDQDENTKDVTTTADIRKSIVATEKMSINARNVKIITSNGKVTLRGPVASADEKEKIGRIAVDVAGEGNVTNELEVSE